jgi:hypothetical protein
MALIHTPALLLRSVYPKSTNRLPLVEEQLALFYGISLGNIPKPIQDRSASQ